MNIKQLLPLTLIAVLAGCTDVYAQRTIIVHDKNDKRLKAYLDSLNAYKEYNRQKPLFIADMKRMKTISQIDGCLKRWYGTYFDYMNRGRDGKQGKEGAYFDKDRTDIITAAEEHIVSIRVYKSPNEDYAAGFYRTPQISPRNTVIYKPVRSVIIVPQTPTKRIDTIHSITRIGGYVDTLKHTSSIIKITP